MRIYLNDLREEVAKTVKKVEADKVRAAHTKSPLKHLALLALDREYWLLPRETWQLNFLIGHALIKLSICLTVSTVTISPVCWMARCVAS